MDRDTKIGLVLALAFIGLVGAVLYHKLQHPETLHAVTPPVLVAQGTAPRPVPPPVPVPEPPPVKETPAPTTQEPPPPAPPTNPIPPSAPVAAKDEPSLLLPMNSGGNEVPPPAPPEKKQEGPGRIVINGGPPPKTAGSWWPWPKNDKPTVVKNDTPMSPPGPPTVPFQPEPPPPVYTPPAQPQPQPVAKKEGGGWLSIFSRKKKEPVKPGGLTFDQPPLLPTTKPEPPPVQDVVLTAPPAKSSGFAPPTKPSGPPEPPPVAMVPEKKNEVPPPAPPVMPPPEKKEETPLLPPPATVADNRTPPSAPPLPPPTNPEPPIMRNAPPAPPVNPGPPVMVRNDPPPAPVITPPPPQVPVMPVAQRKETRPEVPVKDVKPLPPSNTFERSYPPSAALGTPQDSSNASGPTPAVPVAKNSGQPVIIRMQPDLPPAREGIPVITRPGAVITKEYPRPAVQVTSTELRNYTPKQGETYATISRLLYGHEKYEAALAQFNKDRNPRLASVWPGERIVYPSDKEYLERKYPALIGNAAPRSPLDVSGPTSRYLPPNDVRQAEARVSQPPKNPLVSGDSPSPPAANQGKPGGTGNPRYRVREKDSLYSIAQQILGKGDRWNEIYALNKDVVRDPNQPEVGLLLKLPADAKVDTAAPKE